MATLQSSQKNVGKKVIYQSRTAILGYAHSDIMNLHACNFENEKTEIKEGILIDVQEVKYRKRTAIIYVVKLHNNEILKAESGRFSIA